MLDTNHPALPGQLTIDASNVRPHVRWTTPRLLQAALVAIWLGVLLLFLTAFIGIRQHRDAVKTVGQDSAPSIIAAQHIKAYMADMDANATNELIAPPGRNPQAGQAYEERRKDVGLSLVRAAENITYGDAERKPIQTIDYSLHQYELLVTRARTLHERNDLGALSSYRDANRILHETLLTAADALDKANNDVLSRTYSAQKAASVGTTALLCLTGIVLLGVLVAVQLFLSARMRRTLNPALLVSTLLVLFLLVRLVSAFSANAAHLKVVKEDAFDSIRALWQARAVAFDANAEESRYLLDPDRGPEYERGYFDKANRIAKLPSGQTYETVADAAMKTANVPDFTGFLAMELRNTTFEGERDSAAATLRAFGKYMEIDAEIRRLNNAGKRGDAIKLCVGTNPGESNWAYDQFDGALSHTLDINQKAFDSAVEQGFADLQGSK